MEQEMKDMLDRLMLLEAAVTALAMTLPKDARKALADGLLLRATRDGASERAKALIRSVQDGD